ncbi:LapA family protein [Paenibacillus turpanensis]|uniref:LapA family protein n=1 Tax=Paenibacillus turpanensis TaxID=2689078 RepID=UPI00140969C5|nr:lipopolysaccharide assembly protein LapA domain-containing protein [Paenibacillus turpanensis]
MKIQWTMLFALVFALLIGIFAVVNVDPVPVRFVFGESMVPLILVILGSALFGGIVVGLFGIIRQYRMSRKIRTLEASLAEKETELRSVKEGIQAATSHLAGKSAQEAAPASAAQPEEKPSTEKDHSK